MPKYTVKLYTDSIEGCKDFVKHETVYKLDKNTKFEADPYVEGVWRISDLKCVSNHSHHRENHTIIIYMAGYKDPWGQLRESNDFE